MSNKRVIKKKRLDFPVEISLRKSGVTIQINLVESEQGDSTNSFTAIAARLTCQSNPKKDTLTQKQIKERLLARGETNYHSDYTQIMRGIIHNNQVAYKKKNRKLFWALGLLFFSAIVLIAYQQYSLSNARSFAIDMFYDIKTLELSLAQSEIRLTESMEVLDLTIEAILKKQLQVDQNRVTKEKNKAFGRTTAHGFTKRNA